MYKLCYSWIQDQSALEGNQALELEAYGLPNVFKTHHFLQLWLCPLLGSEGSTCQCGAIKISRNEVFFSSTHQTRSIKLFLMELSTEEAISSSTNTQCSPANQQHPREAVATISKLLAKPKQKLSIKEHGLYT